MHKFSSCCIQYVLHVYVFLSIFFKCNALHQYLHSFPTRRSSDLVLLQIGGGELRPRCGIDLPHRRVLWNDQTWNLVLFRSEEHTSELQSRRDLVCRLLLEKKKLIIQNTSNYTVIHTLTYHHALLL